MSARDEPLVISARDLPPAAAASPAEAAPPPEDPPAGAAMVRMAALAARPRSRIAGWIWGLLGGLVSLAVSVALYDFVAGLVARSPALGALALALTGLLALLLALQLVREWIAFRRLARIDDLRAEANAALAAPDAAAAQRLAARLARFYAGRAETRWGRDRLAESRDDILDPDAVLAEAERALLEPLDMAVRREIEAAARIVAGATAFIPLALVDVLAALSANIRMIRRIAEIYGGRAGVLGSWRLLRMVATHLLATGAVAVGDDLIHSVAGGNVLARVSRRFGEGTVNAALTARIGIAAMEVCRPLPFAALPRPRVSNILGRALAGLFGKT